jgi:hypothetical protein
MRFILQLCVCQISDWRHFGWFGGTANFYSDKQFVGGGFRIRRQSIKCGDQIMTKVIVKVIVEVVIKIAIKVVIEVVIKVVIKVVSKIAL